MANLQLFRTLFKDQSIVGTRSESKMEYLPKTSVVKYMLIYANTKNRHSKSMKFLVFWVFEVREHFVVFEVPREGAIVQAGFQLVVVICRVSMAMARYPNSCLVEKLETPKMDDDWGYPYFRKPPYVLTAD